LTKPQSLNKYQYCYNNPLRYTDPDGHRILLSASLFDYRKEAKEIVSNLPLPQAAKSALNSAVDIFLEPKNVMENALPGPAAIKTGGTVVGKTVGGLLREVEESGLQALKNLVTNKKGIAVLKGSSEEVADLFESLTKTAVKEGNPNYPGVGKLLDDGSFIGLRETVSKRTPPGVMTIDVKAVGLEFLRKLKILTE
jgi:hypothetical protein